VKLEAGEVERVGEPGTGFPLATFRYTDQVLSPVDGLALTPPDPSVDPQYAKGGKGSSLIPETHRTGTRMAFIAGQGSMRQSFTIDKAGDYAFVFTAACGTSAEFNRRVQPTDNPLTITIDGQEVWTRTAPHGDRKAKCGIFQYGTRYLPLEPGEHTVTVHGTNPDPSATVYIDACHMGSMQDMAGGPTAPNFTGAGTATSGTSDPFDVTTKGLGMMSHMWGLVPYCYEGGTNPGGDWNGGNVLYARQFKDHHPLSKVADNQWARLWHAAGGANAMFYYDGFNPKFLHKADEYIQWEAAIERAHEWHLEPTEGVTLPATLTCAMPHLQGESASNWKTFVAPWQKWNKPNPRGPKLVKQQWKAWIVNAPDAGEYEITLNATGEGEARLSVNDAQVLGRGRGDTPITGTVWLHKGIHSIKVKCEEGEIEVGEIVARAARP
jgi:hypothetical protein